MNQINLRCSFDCAKCTLDGCLGTWDLVPYFSDVFQFEAYFKGFGFKDVMSSQ